ncbi:MAG: arylsulfatase [Candidatus Hydrogenedentes bacterium]|nr:arylsulfatase [Candidatus Hydrogenedentota bacterium]
MASRRDFLKTAALGGASLAAGTGALAARGARGRARGARRPNVVLVLTDDQGYGDLACLGNPIIQTPNLDRLHGQSTRLTDFHVCPTCAPTRASLMTGRYCNRTGVWHTIMGRSILRSDEVTMAEAFAASGYRTAIFGKWHLGDSYPYRPQDRGFHETLCHGGGGVGQTPDYWGNGYFDDTYWHNGEPAPQTGYCTDVWFDGAMDFIARNKERPFFCYLSTNAPHTPLYVDEKYSKPYKDAGVEPEQAAFYGMIANIDENTGRLMAHLREHGLEDNTILLFITDNGTGTGFRKGQGYNAGMRGTKGSEYDGGHRVPCFIRWPGGPIQPGRDVDRLAAHIDILPSLIELCGLDTRRTAPFDGRSLAPILTDPAAEWADRALVVDSQRIEHPEQWRKCAVMTQRWRLVNGTELYDMDSDPGQKQDAAAAHGDVVQGLRKAYEDWWADTSQRFDEYCPLTLGADAENPVRLTCHDWHGPQVPWNQGLIRKGMEANGFWAVEVARQGTYRFELRRWPVELDAPIRSAVDGGVAIDATRARLRVGDTELTEPVDDAAAAAVFEVALKPGPARLQTWFEAEGGAPRGAYYVYVTRIEER